MKKQDSNSFIVVTEPLKITPSFSLYLPHSLSFFLPIPSSILSFSAAAASLQHFQPTSRPFDLTSSDETL